MVILAKNTFDDASAPADLLTEFSRFPYPLSPFQKHSIQAIRQGQSVLITAHTGSGKTLPAEYAIQYFVEQGKKVVYCSPIKALSNQKFYEFQQKYPVISFGLLTGDNKINPAADCLIMTTEILMNSLVRLLNNESNNSNESINETNDSNNNSLPNLLDMSLNIDEELAAVVLDEVHYINDVGRGHVWEQLIMLLPTKIQLIMLSATIDRPEEFAKWAENCKQGRNTENIKDKESCEENHREIVLSSTNHRIVPLSHHLFLTHTEGHIKKIKDDNIKSFLRKNTNQLLTLQTDRGQWIPDTYTTCQQVLDHIDRASRATGQTMSPKYVLNKALSYLVEKEMVPALLFLFSRKQVEKVAADITTTVLPFDSKVPYIARREIEGILRSKLSNWHEYVALPEYEFLVGLLEKGIGIHHAGMIPIFREIVELFISRRYVYLLIATESFAIGLDCPIKTTIFMGFSKWDGKGNRVLHSHEYTQMAGRAGRRGIDTVGYVVHLPNLYFMGANEYKTMLAGRPEKMVSKFVISYSMVLANLNNVSDFVRQSMMGLEIEKQIVAARTQIESIRKKIVPVLHEPEVYQYHELQKKAAMMAPKKRKEVEKEMEDMADHIPTLLQEYNQYEENKVLAHRIEEEEQYLIELEGYIPTRIEQVCQELERMDMIGSFESNDTDDDSIKSLSRKGEIAIKLKEIDGIMMSTVLIDGYEDANGVQKSLQGLSEEQMVGILAFFLEYDESKNLAESSAASSSATLESILPDSTVRSVYQVLKGLEHDQLDRLIQPYLAPIMMEWFKGCSSEEECKYFLQNRIEGISLGDFVKMVLKVVAAKKELELVAMDHGWVRMQQTLSRIDEGMLKFIMTNQSLYL